MVGPPRLWTCLTTEWCPLPPGLAWVWWKALLRAQWTQTVEWREAFLVFARRDAWVPGEVVEAFFARHCALADLVALLERLMQEKVLTRLEGKKIEETLFGLADKDGQIHPPQGRRQPV